MVAQLLRLKLRLLANTFRRSPWQVVGLVLAILYGFGVAVLGAALLVGLRIIGDVEAARSGVVIAGSLIVVGFVVVPLIFGIDDTLDPRKFALFGIENRRLAGGLLLASLIGVPSAALAIVALATIVTWTRTFNGAFIALVCAVGIVATCVLAARVSTSVASFLLATRRAREFLALIGLLVLVLLSPLLIVLINLDWGRDGAAAAKAISSALAWTPLGAVWAAPADAAAGEWGLAVLHLFIALATIGLLWFGWQALVKHMLVTPQREGRTKSYQGLGWFDRLPGRPGGAVAARTATYWLRDPRYRNSLIIIPPTALVVVVPLLVVGVPAEIVALAPVPIFALLLGWSMHNDVAYDNTAIWLHVASGVGGRADRLGRLFPALAIGVPVILVGSVVSAGFSGNFSTVGGLIGVGMALLLTGMGLASISSARFPYPVVRPGDSAFTQPQSTGATLALVQSLSFVVSLALSSPAIVFALLGYLGDDGWYLLSLAFGMVIGALVFVGGVALGSRIYERRGPELLASALLNA